MSHERRLDFYLGSSSRDTPPQTMHSDQMPFTSVVADNIQSGSNNVQINGPVINYQGVASGKETEKILTWLSTIEYEKHHKRAKQGTTPGTCKWLFKNQIYLDWRNANSSSMLWLRGDPGVGKTKLTASIVDLVQAEAQQQMPDMRTAIAYFYCDRSEPTRSDSGELFRALLKQLSAVQSVNDDMTTSYSLLPPAKTGLSERAKKGSPLGKPDPDECAELILKLLKFYSQTTLIIDALDEVDLETREEVLENLQIIAQGPSTELVKIFISSRNEDDILRHFENYSIPFHYIQPDDNSEDIKAFVTMELNSCIKSRKLLRGKVSSELMAFIYTELINNAHGMFMWVQLQLERFCTLMHEVDIKNAIKTMPKRLNGTYEVIYRCILQEDETCRQVAFAAIQWLLEAIRPLSVDELIGAIYWSGIGKLIEFDYILAACHNLIVLDKQQQVVRFIHLSAREFLEKHPFALGSSTRTRVLKSCLASLAHQNVGSVQNIYLDAIRNYSTYSWPDHIKSMCPMTWYDQQEERSCIEEFLGTPDQPGILFTGTLENTRTVGGYGTHKCYTLPLRSPYWHFYANPPTPIFAASFLGLEAYIEDRCIPSLVTAASVSGAPADTTVPQEVILEENSLAIVQTPQTIDSMNELGETALCIASSYGHVSLVSLLVRNGADMNAGAGRYGPPLSAAARGGHIMVVKFLAENGACLNGEGRWRVIPLLSAAEEGHWEVVKLLAEKGADIDMGGSMGETVLHLAVGRGCFEMVKFLVEKGANLDGGLWMGKTALYTAAERAEWDIVKLLLENGANFTIKAGHNGETALHRAAFYKNLAVVKLLSEKGADLDAKDNRGQTALSLAARAGSFELVEVLLKKGANPNTVDRDGTTPLYLATSKKKWEVVKLLADNGAKLDTRCCPGGETALHQAVRHCCVEGVTLLIEHGADVNTRNSHSAYTPLHVAARAGNQEMIILLSDKGADPNILWGPNSNTALDLAIFYDHGNVARTLVELGAQTGTHAPALEVAVGAGRWKMVKLLVESGSDVNASNGVHGPALLAAAWVGEWELVRLLVDKGADVNARSSCYPSALMMAAVFDKQDIVRLLVSKGARP